MFQTAYFGLFLQNIFAYGGVVFRKIVAELAQARTIHFRDEIQIFFIRRMTAASSAALPGSAIGVGVKPLRV